MLSVVLHGLEAAIPQAMYGIWAAAKLTERLETSGSQEF